MVRIWRELTDSSTRVLLLGASLAAGAAAGACSASLDFLECSNDAECNERFQGEGPLRCNNGRCEEASCSDHGECSSLGENYACGVDGECVDVTSSACEVLHLPGGEIVDELVFIGAIYDEKALDGPQVKAAIKLAAEDFNSKTTLASGKAVAVLGCDSGGTVSGAVTAGRHLAETVGVPAIIGPVDDEAFITVANEVSIKPGNLVYTIAPTSTVPLPAGAGLVWLTTPGSDYYGQALIDRINALGAESAVMIFSQNNYGISLRNGITVDNGMGSLVIPGVAIQTNLSYDSTTTDGTAALDVVLGGVPEPTAVVLIGGDEVGAQIKHLADLGVDPKKIYITQRSLRSVQAALVELGDAALMARVELIAPDAAHPVNAPAFQTRLQAKNPSLMGIGDAANLGYDAAMVTLLAMRSLASAAPLAGPSLQSAMNKMSSGVVVSFGDVEDLAFIATAASEFDKGNTVDLSGTSGELAYNVPKGEPCGPFIAYAFTDLATATLSESATYTLACPAKSGTWTDS